MHDFIREAFRFFARLGGFGLIGLGILDSSFLFMPLGNDLLVVVLTARKPELFWYYALMATAGSLLGCALVDLVARRIGQAGLERMLSEKRSRRVKQQIERHAGWALGVASLMPPPFPFTAFLIAASALQYDRARLFTAIAVGRFVRFTAVAGLAVLFGRQILRLIRRPEVEYFVLGLAAISIVGSIFSVMRWMRSRKASGRAVTSAP